MSAIGQSSGMVELEMSNGELLELATPIHHPMDGTQVSLTGPNITVLFAGLVIPIAGQAGAEQVCSGR